MALENLASVTWPDEPDGALAMLGESIRLTEAGASGVPYGYALSLRAQLQAGTGRPGPAVADLRHAIRYSRDKGDWIMVATVVDRGMMVLTELRQLEAAAVAGVAVTMGAFSGLSILPGRERPDHGRVLERIHADLGDERYTALVASTSVAFTTTTSPKCCSAGSTRSSVASKPATGRTLVLAIAKSSIAQPDWLTTCADMSS